MRIKILNRKSLLFFLGLIVIFILITLSLFPESVFAGVGQDNVTVITNLTIGNVIPEVNNVSIDNNASTITLTPNSTKIVTCKAFVTDYNGWNDVWNGSAVFFDNSTSNFSDVNDNNTHYYNSSCTLTQYDTYSLWVNCTFTVQYYANPGIWNCTLLANDSKQTTGQGNDVSNISQLLALALPDFIYYGNVSAMNFSGENVSNVSNAGNVKVNLSLSGYGFRENDGNAMNCTLGSIKNISIQHEKYNLTVSHSGVLTSLQITSNYTNLSAAPTPKIFNLDYRRNDTHPFVDDTNSTYWRIYVPLGVAGTCQGNIIFGAVVAPGS